MIEQSSTENWMDEITPKTATLKIRDREVCNFVFKDNGRKKESADYGSSIAFLVLVDGEQEQKTFYVKSNNFDFLGQIKEMANNGSLVGIHVQVSRTGSKKSDTRYRIKKF